MNFDFWSTIPRVSQNLFLGGILLFMLSFFMFYSKRKGMLFCLGASAFLVAAAFSTLVPWLFTWDEQFHALVGKNLSKNPFHPILIDIDPAILNGKDWSDQRTWLHKQPLFLYQIALSLKVLGNTAFAVRLPSIILHTIGVLVLIDMGKILHDKKTGFLAASLFLFSFYPLGMLSGRIGTDHNDSVFMAFVLFSFWAYFKYMDRRNKKWLIYLGIFAGLAILTKWLVGLLVFAPWIMNCLLNKDSRNKKSLYDISFALLITILVVIPWQLFIHMYFPVEATYELNYNARHLFEAIEGHRASWTFHFENLERTFFTPWILVPLLLISIHFQKKTWNQKHFALWLSSILVFTFFTMVKTKMVSFVMVVYPLILLIIAFGIVSLLENISSSKIRKAAFIVVGSLFIFIVFKPQKLIQEAAFEKDTPIYGANELYQKQLNFIQKNSSNDPKSLVVNAYLRGHGNISWMFFSEEKALSYVPTPKQIQQLKNQHYKIKCIQWNDPLPAYILSDKSIEILPFE